MQRVIPISIDVATGTSQSEIVMYRGDNVKFEFTFTNTDNVSLSSATKLRVQAKPAKNLNVDYVWFAGETTITDLNYNIEFTSDLTSGYDGDGFLAVLLLDANNQTVCTGGLPFRVEPSGYDGIFNPSQSFRDEVIDAKNQAIAAKDAAVIAKEQAEQYAASAEVSANQTDTNATFCEQQTVIVADYTTQATQAKNDAIAAANQAEQVVGLKEVARDKDNTGVYYFNGGTLTSSNFNLTKPFTYFITYKAGFTGNLFTKANCSLIVDENSIITLSDGVTSGSDALDNTKDHLIAIIIRENSAVLIKDNISTTISDFNFTDNSSGVVIGGTTTDGKLARPILFNFDIEENNAPFTFEDYKNGIALSPYLTNPIAKVEDSNLGASTDGGWDITANPTSTITKGKWTANSGTYIAYLKNRTIGSAETAAGIEYAVDLRSTTILGGGGCLFYNDNALTMYNTGKAVIRVKFKYLKITSVGGTSPYTGLTIAQTSGENDAIIHLNNGSVTDHNWHEYNQILTANTNKASNANGSRIGLSAGGLASGETGPSWSIADFHFEILGALFAPADYMITTGTTRNVPDNSGNGFDATITGNLGTFKTTKDNYMLKMKQYFTANS